MALNLSVRKTALLLSVVTFVGITLAGLVAALYLSGQSADIRNQAAVADGIVQIQTREITATADTKTYLLTADTKGANVDGIQVVGGVLAEGVSAVTFTSATTLDRSKFIPVPVVTNDATATPQPQETNPTSLYTPASQLIINYQDVTPQKVAITYTLKNPSIPFNSTGEQLLGVLTVKFANTAPNGAIVWDRNNSKVTLYQTGKDSLKPMESVSFATATASNPTPVPSPLSDPEQLNNELNCTKSGGTWQQKGSICQTDSCESLFQQNFACIQVVPTTPQYYCDCGEKMCAYQGLCRVNPTSLSELPGPTPVLLTRSTPSPSPFRSPTPSPFFTPTPSPYFTPTPSPFFTPTPSPYFTPTPSPFFTPTPSPWPRTPTPSPISGTPSPIKLATPLPRCTYTYQEWGPCVNGLRTRIAQATGANLSNCIGSAPAQITESCAVSTGCQSNEQCSNGRVCLPSATGVRTCQIRPQTTDLNGDGRINILDLSLIIRQFNTTTSRGDLSGDGRVDITDYSLMLQFINQASGSFASDGRIRQSVQ